MCTVTYLPFKNNEFILTSNRDEKSSRASALSIKPYKIGSQKIFFPKDTQAGGTWIACSENYWTACLLNGAFIPHQYNPPYRLSRGLMLLDFFGYQSVDDFIENYNFIGIEPFTLLLIHHEKEIIFSELRWDGLTIHKTIIDQTQPHIWSSVTLYSPKIIETRQQWFNLWLMNNKNYTEESIINFHRNGGNGDMENDLMMQRGETMKTVSITCIAHLGEQIAMKYFDTKSGTKNTSRIVSYAC